MEDANHDQTAQPPIAPEPSPPNKIYMTVGEMPKTFTHEVLMRAFSDYSVELGRAKDGVYSTFGTGVLVRRAKRFGILTAYHCLHSCTPRVRLGSEDGDTLWLVLNRGRTVMVKPQEVLEHSLAKPQSEEFGPDLTFIEILSIERLGTFNAVGSFWSLDRRPSDVMHEFGSPLTPIASIGFPEVHYNTIKDGNRVRHQIRHMVYDNAIKKGDVFEKVGWDYLDTTIWYPGDPDLPRSFRGVSGGPVWGMELRKHKSDGPISIEKYALIGITFYEIYRKGDEGRLRAHFINSIYDLAWRDLD
jgi:hypothetical protein